jgi:hypothetical protein
MDDTARLILFTLVWTAVWVAPLPRLGLVAVLALVSLRVSGLSIERFLAASISAPVLGLVAGSAIGAVTRSTPSPIPEDLRRRAAVAAILTVPAMVAVGTGALRLISGLPPEHASQSESIVALVSGASAGLIGWAWGGFERPRSRFLFAMAIGVAAGAVVALYA